jgi:hypothetical protein
MKRKQIMGIAGMVLAILGGIAWFYQQYIPAAILWAAAAIIVFRLNKMHPQQKNQQQKRKKY